jgi:hypothetical protein
MLFVLMGGVVTVLPVRAAITKRRRSFYSHVSIRIDIEPWVSSETLMRLWTHLRTDVLGYTPRHDPRHRCEVLRFVTERTTQQRRPDGRMMLQGPSWRVLTAEWNALHPERPYSTYRALARDYSQMYLQIMDAARADDHAVQPPTRR